MKFSGQHEFNVDAPKLWNYLMDPEVLAKITPGVTKLQTIDVDQYKSISNIKIGPVKGMFTGKLSVSDKQKPETFTIQMEQLSKIGNAHAEVNMVLAELKRGTTQLSFNANAKLSGVIARTGQRVLSGVANTLTKEVFSSLQIHIDEQLTLTEPIVDHSSSNAEKITEVPETPTFETTKSNDKAISVFTRIINLIKKIFGIKS